MKNLLSFLLMYLFIITCLSAQSPLTFGLKAGLNIGNVDEIALDSDVIFTLQDYTGLPTTTTARPQLGLWLSIPVTENWRIQPELLWSRKVLKYQSSNPDLAYTRFNYLSLPLLAAVNFHPNWRLEFGPEVSYLLNFELEDPQNTGIEKSPLIEENSLEFGANLGLCYQLDGWSLGARYHRSLTSVQTFDFFQLSGVPAGEAKQYHQGVTLWLGYEIFSSKS